MVPRLRALAAAAALMLAVSAGETAFAEKLGGILKIGQFDSPARTVHQSDRETRFKRRNRTTDAGLGHTQSLGGPTEAPCIGEGREDDETTDQPTIDVIHD